MSVKNLVCGASEFILVLFRGTYFCHFGTLVLELGPSKLLISKLYFQRNDESRMMSFQPPELRFFHQHPNDTSNSHQSSCSVLDPDLKPCSNLDGAQLKLCSNLESAGDGERFEVVKSTSSIVVKGASHPQAVFNRDRELALASQSRYSSSIGYS